MKGRTAAMDETTRAKSVHARPYCVRGVVSRICSVSFTLIIGLIIAVAGGMLVAQGLGFKPLAILSGSMEPNYKVNGLIFVDTNVKVTDIKAGDIITFGRKGKVVVTHRVLKVDDEAREFTTKGDANEVADGPVSWDSMVGRAALYIPHLGGLALGIRSKKGIAMGMITLALLIIFFVIPVILAPPWDKKKSGACRDERPELVE